MPTVLERDATITQNGQTTVPKQIREALGVGSGDKIRFRLDERGMVSVYRPDTISDDPVILAFLDLLAREIRRGKVSPLTSALKDRVGALIEGVSVAPDEDIEGEVAL